MGSSRVRQIWPKQVQSVGAMRDGNALVAALCEVCRLKFRVDLDAIIYHRGRSFSLIDQRGPCRQYDCKGSAFFIWSPGENVPWRALTTEAGEGARMATPPPEPPDDPPPCSPPPRAPAGVCPKAWGEADHRERLRLVRRARD